MNDKKKNYKKYVGAGWRKNFRNESYLINLEILSGLLPSPDIDGKVYLTVSPRKKLGYNDETHCIYVNDYKTLNVEPSIDDNNTESR